MLHTRPWLGALILLAIILVLLVWRCRHAWQQALPQLPKRIWRLHPGAPDACPHCRLAATSRQGLPAPTVHPWRDGRSRRGAPRRVLTDGYACRNPRCLYVGVTDAHIHALVADGHQGRSARIQRFRRRAIR